MAGASYDACWLRYEPATEEQISSYRRLFSHAYVSDGAPELVAVREELRHGIGGVTGREPHVWHHPPQSVEAFLTIGLPDEMRPISETVDIAAVQGLNPDGYVIRSVTWEGIDCTVVTAPNDRGLVYGTFHLLRLLTTSEPVDDLDIVEEPANEERIINHWDNPFHRSVERGYAGPSIFDWESLPDRRERYVDYARLLASVGINGISVNNVNTKISAREGANEAVSQWAGWQLLESANLEKVAALASVFRRYGIRTYLSVNYAAPMLVGDLETADPLNSAVEQWWATKADEIYDLIPDFGGFVMKADSEGQTGPYDYGRDHAEGANVIARALAPHDGRVWWRAFVYSDHNDRAVQAYDTFEPLDGTFEDNVTVQVKNGPIDFQPREPISTLFGTMPETTLSCELQITQEYTGQGVHTSFLVPQWKEVLEFDTYADGEGTPVKDVLRSEPGQGIVGVGLVGEDPNWTGHYLAQANLYGFGRLAWDPDLMAETIVDEWIRGTFGHDPNVVKTLSWILLDSWGASIDYHTGGLGLMHLMYNGSAALENHYDPAPEEWPVYHGASAEEIGIDRTSTGSGYVEQYREPIAERYESVKTCPEELLLFFHRLPWDHELADGTTVVQRLYDNCHAGVEAVRSYRDAWKSLEGNVDDHRHRHIAERFDEQVVQAAKWCNVLCQFFYDHSDIPDKRERLEN
ncbi:alpha-glucuronidase family glycosyl hydrolase [Halegenticoccus tardaugens]|uniref:alpha-glucuronidase family glycosyl hydrolase n=1 Tax=Halegenticoccus tardaugens TaxID=2071624 RepID=UPI00100B6771|nr:alpha-glucuronidase family glycosyl hydrolase [Halegenticoccus tardaugens]